MTSLERKFKSPDELRDFPVSYTKMRWAEENRQQTGRIRVTTMWKHKKTRYCTENNYKAPSPDSTNGNYGHTNDYDD